MKILIIHSKYDQHSSPLLKPWYYLFQSKETAILKRDFNRKYLMVYLVSDKKILRRKSKSTCQENRASQFESNDDEKKKSQSKCFLFFCFCFCFYSVFFLFLTTFRSDLFHLGRNFATLDQSSNSFRRDKTKIVIYCFFVCYCLQNNYLKLNSC